MTVGRREWTSASTGWEQLRSAPRTAIVFAATLLGNIAAAQPCAPTYTYFPNTVGPDRFVSKLVVHDGTLIAFGGFTTVAGIPSPTGIATYDGSTWRADQPVSTTWTLPGANAALSWRGQLHATAGRFITSPNSVGAIFNGSSWQSWPTTGLYVETGSPAPSGGLIVEHNGKLIAVGAFRFPPVSSDWPYSVQRFAQWNGSSWERLGTGYGPSWPGTNDSLTGISAMQSYKGELYVAGAFQIIRNGELNPPSPDTTPARGLVKWNGSSWQTLPNGGVEQINAMTVYNNELILVGTFSSTVDGTVPLNRIARFDGTTFRPLAGGLTDMVVRSLTVADDGRGLALFIGGSFGYGNNSPPPTTDRVAFGLVGRWDGSRFTAMSTGVFGTSTIFDLVGYDSGAGSGVFIASDVLRRTVSDSPGGVARWGPAPQLDTDGDGLYDAWEQFGIDADCNGTIDLDLPARGANKLKKDLFLELDAMTGRAPGATTIPSLVTAFANAPVPNPDGSTGITLHIQPDELTLPLTDFPNQFDDFHAVKASHFGSVVERANPNARALLEAKSRVYRYTIFANTHSNGPSSGLSELPGNDFMVTLGAFDTPGGTDQEQAATLMHEMGHTLGLYHGGHQIDWNNDRRYNYKPNYHSIMNYAWQLDIATPGWSLDYSRQILPPLNENALIEPLGIQGSAAAVAFVGPAPGQGAPEAGPIDWNRNGSLDVLPAVADANHVIPFSAASPGDILEGSEDWSRLEYNFRNSPNYAPGNSPQTTESMGELDAETAALIASLRGGSSCPCPADFDASGGTPDINDIDAYFTAWIAGNPAADADCSGGTPDVTDIDAFFIAWLAGGC